MTRSRWAWLVMGGILMWALLVYLPDLVRANSPDREFSMASPERAGHGIHAPALPTSISVSQPMTALYFSEAVDRLFSQSDSTEKLSALDREFSRFIKSDEVPRGDKLNVLFDMATNRSEYQAIYTIDNLALLFPIELAPELIQLFLSTPNQELQKHILAALHGSLTVDFEELGDQAPPSELTAAGRDAILSLAEKLSAGDDPLAKYAVLEMTALQPRDVREKIMSTLAEKRRVTLGITPTEYGNLAFDIAVSNPEPESKIRFRDIFDQSVLESDPEFVARVLSTFEQIAADPRYQDFARESLARVGDLVLYPELFVKAKLVHMALDGVLESDRLERLRLAFKDSSTLERSAFVLGGSEQVVRSENEGFKITLTEEFGDLARKSAGTTRAQLLSASFLSAELVDDETKRNEAIRDICKEFGSEEAVRLRCAQQR